MNNWAYFCSSPNSLCRLLPTLGLVPNHGFTWHLLFYIRAGEGCSGDKVRVDDMHWFSFWPLVWPGFEHFGWVGLQGEEAVR